MYSVMNTEFINILEMGDKDPVKMVVGEAEIVSIIEDEPEIVWELTSDYSGIAKEFFDRYYKDKNKAVAYKLGKIKKYREPLRLSDFGIKFAPQSFVYVK